MAWTLVGWEWNVLSDGVLTSYSLYGAIASEMPVQEFASSERSLEPRESLFNRKVRRLRAGYRRMAPARRI